MDAKLAPSFNLGFRGEALIKRWESCKLSAYRGKDGIWTIGWGHTKGVYQGMTCTQAQADDWFRDDLVSAIQLVRANVKVLITQGMFDALTSIMYNVGPGRVRTDMDPGRDGIVVLATGRPSTLLRVLNLGQYLAARDAFASWSLIHGEVSTGLMNRRRAEQALFDADGYPEKGE